MRSNRSCDWTLSLYYSECDMLIAADASFELGAVLKPNGQLQAVVDASRVMIDTEKRYAQVEKEALGNNLGMQEG